MTNLDDYFTGAYDDTANNPRTKGPTIMHTPAPRSFKLEAVSPVSSFRYRGERLTPAEYDFLQALSYHPYPGHLPLADISPDRKAKLASSAAPNLPTRFGIVTKVSKAILTFARPLLAGFTSR